MIVISGALVVAALVLLVIGILDTNLPFVYASIGVSLASLLSLVVGILQRRGEALPGEAVHEREATSAQVDERTVPGTGAEQDRTDQLTTVLSPAPAGGSVGSGSRRLPPAGQPVSAEDDPGTDGAQAARAGDQVEDGYEAGHAVEAGQGAPAGAYDEEGRYDEDASEDGPYDDGPYDDGPYEDEGPYDELDDDQHDDQRDDEGADDQQDDEGPDDASGAPGPTSDATVLVVDGRPRYHLAECRYLIGKDAQVIGLHDAREIGFSPCGVCKPDSVLEQSAPEPPGEAPPSDEPEADGSSRVQAEDRRAASHDEPEPSVEEILFGEPVFTAPDGEQRPPTSAASERWQRDQQDGAEEDDDTQTLEVVAVDDEAADPTVTGEVEEQPDRDDESEDGRRGEPAQADLPAEAPSDAGPDEPEAQDQRAVTAGADQRERAEAAPTGRPATTTDVDEAAFVDGTLAVPPWALDEPAAAGAATAKTRTDETAGTPAEAEPAAPPMGTDGTPTTAEAAVAAAPAGADELPADELPADEAALDRVPAATAMTGTAAATAAADEAPAKKAAAKKAAKKAPAKKAPAKKAPAKATATKATATKAPAKAAAKTAPPSKAPSKAAAKKAQAAEAPASRAAARKAPAGSSGSKAAATADPGSTTAPVERTAAVRAAAPPQSSTGSARPAAGTVRAAAPKLPAGRLRTAPGRTAVVAAPRVAAAPVRPSAVPSASPAASGRTSGQVVVIPDGGKFHRSSCRYVRDEPAAEPLSAARAVEQGYAPCGVCKP